MTGKNVLILCSDEHARSAAGCYGHPVVQTPTLDRLAERGTRFSRAYTPSPICVPARACLATGLHVHENRCWSSAEPYYGQIESWMHRLRDGGHTVVSVGKLHFRSRDDDNGFSDEIVPMHLANDGKGWPQGLVREPLPSFDEAAEMARDVGPGDTSYTDYDRQITSEARGWLGRYAGALSNNPWALFVSFVSPHYPLTAPQAFYDLYDGVQIPEPIGSPCAPRHPVLQEMSRFWDYDSYFNDETRRIARRAYFGLCSFLDDNIRQVLEALETSGTARDTVVIYLSDHGEMLGNHGFWAKSVMYEDSVGVPLIMAGSDIPAGVNDTPVSITDIAATVEHIVGLGERPLKSPWQSRSLARIAARADPDRMILSEYHDGGSPTGFFMLRQRDLKYVHYAGGHPPQLFDLSKDPNELDDLGQQPGFETTCSAMHRKLREILDPEAVNAAAFADQKALLEQYGGAESVLSMPSFNHTPVGS